VAGFKTASVIISRAARALGLVSADITNPYASTDANVLLLTTLLQDLGEELVRDHPWSQLQKEGDVTTANGTASYALETDFQRMLSSTLWNRTLSTPIPGSLTPQQWQAEKARASTGVYKVVRIKQDLIYLHPTPTAIESLYYEYISSWWVMPSGQTTPTTDSPTAGTDTLWFDPLLLVRGLKLKFREKIGADTTAYAADFNAALDAAKSQDGLSPKLSIGGTGAGERFLGDGNAPETGFGS
jgi:hypothetical protein